MINKKVLVGMSFLIGILLVISFTSALTSRSNPQFVNPGVSSSYYLSKQGISLTPKFDEDQCQAGQDFVVQISPLGCEPSVIRSDLLEEQNVPVFCPLVATKINPLITVKAIDSISFSGKEYPKEVSGVGFHPANAAIKSSQSTLLNSPVMENIGYVVIVLNKNKNESSMPDFVAGNLTANIKYDIQNAFGIGKATYFLPEMTDSEWDEKYKSYGFWRGKGYLRAQGIDEDGATILVYNDKDDVVSSFNLNKGETSREIYLPGFYCMANLKVKLDSFENPETKARLSIDGNIVELSDGERFLENRCKIVDLEKLGLLQWVKINCKGDEARENIELAISPTIKLKIGEDEAKNYEIGEKLFNEGSNAVYLSFVGTVKKDGSLENSVFGTEAAKDLEVFLYKSTEDKEKLSEEEIYARGREVNSWFFSLINRDKTSNTESVKYTDENGKVVFSKNVQVLGFSETNDLVLDKVDFTTNFESANKDYQKILESYAGEKKTVNDLQTFGQKALFEAIKLSSETGQKLKMVGLCDEYSERYPDSYHEIKTFCGSAYELSNSKSARHYVSMNGWDKSISFEGITEPGFEDYGAVIRVGNKEYDLRKEQVVYINEKNDIEYIQLVSINDEKSVRIKFKLFRKDSFAGGKEYTISKLGSGDLIQKDAVNTLGSNYQVVLKKVNIKKSAKVSVIPGIDNAGTKSDFSFNIGIEKRAIQLSPEKIEEKIASLNKTIKEWTKISDNLGNLVKGFKAGCLATGTYLVVKNFWNGMGGQAAARHEVMPSWRDWCKNNQKDVDLEKCLLDKNDEINADVEALAELKNQKTEVTEKAGNFDDVRDKIEFPDEATKTRLEAYWNKENHDRDVQEIYYYQQMREKGGRLEKIADARLKELWERAKDEQERLGASVNQVNAWESSGLKGMRIRSLEEKDKRREVYDGATIPSSSSFGKIPKDTPVQGINFEHENYIVSLNDLGDNEYAISNVYDVNGGEVSNTISNKIKGKYSSFKKYTDDSYLNKYDNPEVIYYEVGEFKGRPAIVPVDTSKGWYAATRAGTGTIKAFDSSGRVNYFYLCNVMENNREEFNAGKDKCIGINAITSASDSSFEGLSEAETVKWGKEARKAINEASRKHSSGMGNKITILGQPVGIGNPAVNLPGTQCTDFMSPEDCSLLFNLCDPVVCPESRCNFGGSFRVSNVVQSGIIGSLVLCLPNFPQVKVPICLTGIKAGIDGLISVFKNYRDCLQKNLDSGETVGICDEMHSIYLCDFLWKQALPFTKIIFTEVLENVLSGNLNGGGEYSDVAGSWANAEKSVTYITQYYAANSFAAFKARSTDQIGTEVCKNFISARYPASGDFFDALLEPDSPAQFHGRFDETPFTTGTVPATSQYKVFYHIFAGKDSGVYYSVYLRSPIGSSYYQDNPTVNVGSGYIGKGEYASETVDFTAPAGYQEMCINVQGQEECGFKQVSTSMAVNYVKDQYLAEQANKRDIKTEKECISGSASAFNLLNPNLQAGVEEALDPQLENKGITRVCSTNNPGDATKPERWVEVGNCDEGKGNMICWLDTESVKNVIHDVDTEKSVLKDQAAEHLKKLNEKLDPDKRYFIDGEFENEVEKINADKDENSVILIVDSILGRAFYNREKAELILLRGMAYGRLAMNAYKADNKEKVSSLGGDDGDRGEEVVNPEGDNNEVTEEQDNEDIIEGYASGLEGENKIINCGDCLGETPCNTKVSCNAINSILIDKNCVFKDSFCVEIFAGEVVKENEETFMFEGKKWKYVLSGTADIAFYEENNSKVKIEWDPQGKDNDQFSALYRRINEIRSA